jgi:hypothetical protein
MQSSPFLSLAVTAALIGPATAQLLIGTAPSSGSATPPEIFHMYTYGATTPNIWSGISSMGMAADEVGRIVYTSVVGAGDFGDLYRWPYDDMNAPTLVGRITDVGSNHFLRLEGLTCANGALHAVQNSVTSTDAPEGIYRIDLTTLTATAVYVFPNTAIDVSGLGFNHTTGRFYCPNNSTTYPGGRGIVEVDPNAQTEVRIAPFPSGTSEIEGCTVDPIGVLYLIGEQGSALIVYELNFHFYATGWLQNPVTVTQPHAGAAWAPHLLGPYGIGTNYCTATQNSTGTSGIIAALGSPSVAANDVTLRADRLPRNAFSCFLTSRDQGFVAHPAGSSGNLCLGGTIGRYVGPGQIQNSGQAGSIVLALNLAHTPQPTGFVAIVAGDTWNFTCWHRQSDVGGVASSNFTDGLSIGFEQ